MFNLFWRMCDALSRRNVATRGGNALLLSRLSDRDIAWRRISDQAPWKPAVPYSNLRVPMPQANAPALPQSVRDLLRRLRNYHADKAGYATGSDYLENRQFVQAINLLLNGDKRP